MLNNKAVWCAPRLNLKSLHREALQSTEAVFVMVDVQCEIPTTSAGIGPEPVQCRGAHQETTTLRSPKGRDSVFLWWAQGWVVELPCKLYLQIA